MRAPRSRRQGVIEVNYVGTKGTHDATLMKNFNLSERRYMQRLEAYSVTNSLQWGTPNTSFGSTSFGQITSASGNRAVQIAGKFYF